MKPAFFLSALLCASAFGTGKKSSSDCPFGDLAPKAIVSPLPVLDNRNWIPAKGEVILNGTLVDVTDAQGQNPRRILILSHPMTTHVTKSQKLAGGMKIQNFVHRGEYQFKDGVLARVNETSGNAKRDQAVNPVGEARAYLAGTPWVSPETDYVSFKKGEEHFYEPFNKRSRAYTGDKLGDTEIDLHLGREDLETAFGFAHHGLKSLREMPPVEDSRKLLEHWPVLMQGVGADSNVDFLKSALEKHAQDPAWRPTLAEQIRMNEAFTWIEEEWRELQYVEVKREDSTR